MPITKEDLQEIQARWGIASPAGNLMAALAGKALVAFVKADGTIVEPHADTIADIKTEFAALIPDFEAALVAMKAAYTP